MVILSTLYDMNKLLNLLQLISNLRKRKWSLYVYTYIFTLAIEFPMCLR